MRRFGICLALALVVVVSGVVLVGVYFNRHGQPDADMNLTERELSLGPMDEENSVVTLHLNWRAPVGDKSDWFGPDKLKDVGFDCDVPASAPEARMRYAKMLPRKAFAVFEYAGAAWKAHLAKEREQLAELASGLAEGTVTRKQLETAQRSLEWDEVAGSRLYVVDVGKDPRKLRGRYNDAKRYIVAPVLVRLQLDAPLGKLTGSIEKVLSDTVQVPADMVRGLGKLGGRGGEGGRWSYPMRQAPDGKPQPARYAVRLCYGKRFEPWVVAVWPLEKR